MSCNSSEVFTLTFFNYRPGKHYIETKYDNLMQKSNFNSKNYILNDFHLNLIYLPLLTNYINRKCYIEEFFDKYSHYLLYSQIFQRFSR